MRYDKLKITLVVVCVAILGVVGCSGGDTDGGHAADQDFHDAPFVPNEENSGSISLEVIEEELNVADSTGFFVTVKDAAGLPVDDITVACDSEAGIAILEPTTGAEITDSGGRISGRIGCDAPGSYLFGCRLPVGGNLRKFVTVRCGGSIPTGFTGFEGAAGGGLGTGGSDTDEDAGVGGTDTAGIRVTRITVNDEGNADDTAAAFEVDTVQSVVCTPDDPDTAVSELEIEPIFNTYTTITVVNNTNSTIKFDTLKISIPGIGTSSAIAFIGEGTVPPDGGEAKLTALAFTVVGTSTAADKFLIRGSSSSNIAIPGSTGPKNTKFTLTGTNSQESVSVSGTTAITYANFNRCDLL